MKQRLLLILIYCCLFPLQGLLAGEVTAIGQAGIVNNNVGGAREQALQNAQRQAVEQGVGALIDSKSLSKNFEIVEDQIYSVSRGFISKYSILEEKRSEDGSNYEVKIQATVEEGALQDKLTALRILHKKMGNKRVMVIYRPKDPEALPRNHGAVGSALMVIREELNKNGFRMFNEDVTNQVYGIIEKAGRIDRPNNDLIAIALDHHAEIFIEFELVAGNRGQLGGQFHAAKTSLKLGAYDTSTGQQMSDVIAYGKQLSTQAPGKYELNEMIGKASQSAALDTAQKFIQQATDYYQGVEDQGTAYHIIFRNFSADEEDLILETLENTPGIKGLSELTNTINYLEIELFSSENKSRFRRKLRSSLKEKHLYFNTQDASGNRLIFIKSTTESAEEHY